jgi:YcxB-like protein
MFTPWLLVVLAAPFLLQPRASLLSHLLPAAIFAVVGLVLARVYWPRQVRRSAIDQRMLYQPFQTRIDDDGFETRTEFDHQRRHWSDFSSWYEDALLFVVAESSAGVRVVPKRVLGGADQIAELRTLFQRHLGQPR